MSHSGDFRLLPPCPWDLRRSVMLRNVDWYLPTFRENLLVPYSRVKQPKRNYSWMASPLKREPCRLSWNVGDYQYTLRNIVEERRSRVSPASTFRTSEFHPQSVFVYLLSKKVKCTLVHALRLCTSSATHRGNRGIALPFLDHGTRGVEGPASRSGRSFPLERPGTPCTGGWMDPRAGLDRCGKSRPHRDSIPVPSSP
jgi:hypothetical protein